MSKNDMKKRICTLFKNDLKDLVKTYRIPQDLHPRFPDPGFTMDRLPGDAIDIYTEFLWFSGVCIPFSTFLLSVLKYFKSDAQVVEESHNLSSSLLDHVSSHTTAPAAEGAMILLPNADEIAASLLDLRLAKKSKGLSQARVRSSSDNAPEPSQQLKRRKLRKENLRHLTYFVLTLKRTQKLDSKSRHMTRGTKPYLTDYHDIDGGFVAFGEKSRG
ncbi:hypothetical protein Tco_0178244 [Tanacetum coccineum]